MGTNPCAVDTVCCHMANVDPESVVHLKLAAQRGIGPIRLEEIELGGDYPLEAVQRRTQNYKSLYVPIDKAFDENEMIRCVVGTFPEDHSRDYCWGGCPGSLTELWALSKVFYPDVLQRMRRKLVYVVGEVSEDLDVGPDEMVLFAGDCVRWEGTIHGSRVKIEGRYRNAAAADPRKAKSNDMILKIVEAKTRALANRLSGKPYIHMKGCPLSVAQLVSYYCTLFGIPDFNLDKRFVFSLNAAYWQMRANRFKNRLFG